MRLDIRLPVREPDARRCVGDVAAAERALDEHTRGQRLDAVVAQHAVIDTVVDGGMLRIPPRLQAEAERLLQLLAILRAEQLIAGIVNRLGELLRVDQARGVARNAHENGERAMVAHRVARDRVARSAVLELRVLAHLAILLAHRPSLRAAHPHRVAHGLATRILAHSVRRVALRRRDRVIDRDKDWRKRRGAVHARVAIALLHGERRAHEADTHAPLHRLEARQPPALLVQIVLDRERRNVERHREDHRLHDLGHILEGIFLRRLDELHDVERERRAIDRAHELRRLHIEPE